MERPRTMTYYLVRHLTAGGTDVIPFRSDNPVWAIKEAIKLHEPRALALYAQLQDNHGRIVCTLSGNDAGPGKTKVAAEGQLFPPRRPTQLKIPFN